MRKGRKEKYIHRWLREHPKLQIYLNKEEYEWLKRIADERGVSMKEVVFEAIKNARKFYEKGFDDGVSDVLKVFIEKPEEFYEIVMSEAEMMELYKFEPCLFTIPCPICGESMVFTHKFKEWANKVKPTLLKAFKNWYHVKCGQGRF